MTSDDYNELAKLIDNFLQERSGQKLGFFLSIFQFDTPGVANYVSNARREDVIEALEETAYRFKHGQDKLR